MKKMTIKAKLIALTLFVAIGFITIIMSNKVTSEHLHQLDMAKRSIELLSIDVLKLRKNEKDFLKRKDVKYEKQFNEIVSHIYRDMSQLKSSLSSEGINIKNIDNFNEIIISYKNIFHTIVESQQKIGLTSKNGLYGELRNNAHTIQDYIRDKKDYELLADIFILRKNEKDFMLRRELKYVNKFDLGYEKVMALDLDSKLKADIKKYRDTFISLVKEEKIFGLKNNNGLLAKMRGTVHKTEDIILKLKKNINVIIDEKESSLMIINLIIAFSIMSFIVIMTFLIGRGISKSIDNFQVGLFSFFKYLNRESSSVDELVVEGKDEINSMAKVVNDNIQMIQKNIEKDRDIIKESVSVLSEYEKGDFNLKINNKSANNSLNELTSYINTMGENIERNIYDILKVINEFSNSNFINKVNTEGIKGHLEKLALGVNSSGDSTSSILKQSLEIGTNLDKSSDVLIENVDILNNSSNEAAASLEETAAALEEITSTIVSTTENIGQMANYSRELSSSIKIGQELAYTTVNAMDEINSQTVAIADAITLIDQIAFQTNILSLHSAVEAATAGDAGKGFAVVAQEVRNLASRSAAAAKEIKDLVETATDKTNAGKESSDKMIAGYENLNKNIVKTTEIINDIAVSAKEQQGGIEQINDAVSKLDQQTQANAQTASKTSAIAIETDAIAKQIVKDALSKEFIGKNEVQQYNSTENKEICIGNEMNDSCKKVPINTANQTSFKDKSKNDEWENF